MTLTPSNYGVIEHTWITLNDGRKLATRAWYPLRTGAAPLSEPTLAANLSDEPVPAILEYLPYRKRDGTAARDESTHPVFAANGYVCVRVDIAGHGESDGSFDDEYSPRELSDGLEVIHWLAQQSWCNGNVGLMGISWGGFNALQLAALEPAPVKAIISLSSVVDRYNQDIHFKNGCHLYSNLYWATVMLSFASRPPDPQLRDDWRELWLQRLATEPWLYETWMDHQRRDGYWRHGSVCEDYQAIKAATLIIGGWADLYVDAPPAAIENLSAPCKAINGPWIHKYPHFAWPRPRMDFHREALAWWDHWLKGHANEVNSLPAYRAFIAENTRPAPERKHEQGRWVAETHWPAPTTQWQAFYCTATGQLQSTATDNQSLTICSPQDCGTACGEIFTLKPDAEMAGDQRVDDAGSLLFTTPALNDAIEILGAPNMHVDIAIDQPVGNLIVRLLDIHPDGLSHRVSWSTINLCHRFDNHSPVAMTPGKNESITLSLEHCGYRFLPGHRIGVAISTAYWPMLVPPPYAVTASITTGNTRITLPTRAGGDHITLPEPLNTDPLPDYQQHSPAVTKRTVERDLQQHLTHYCVIDDTGEEEMPEHGLIVRYSREERWSICPDDPLSVVAQCTHTSVMRRQDWCVRTETRTALSVDETHFHTQASVIAFENDTMIHQREWKKSQRRDFM